MRFAGRGHPDVRGTHAKTLELIAGPDITARATCVVAVEARAEPPAPLAGPVRITLRAGEHEFALHARANPGWAPAGAAVIRRSPLRLPGTFATHADAAAADLPRELVAALQRADTRVEVRVEPVRSDRATVVLFAADPERADDPRLRAELAAADAILAQDELAHRLVIGHRGTLARTPAPSGRTLVVAARELPGASMWTDLHAAETEVVGLPARLAAAAASPTCGPVLLGGAGAPRELIRTAPATARLVVTAPADDLAALLAVAATHRGGDGASVMQDYAQPLRVTSSSVAQLASREPVHICFDAQPASTALEPRVRTAITGLLADGASTKITANALAALTGWERRRAYAAVVELRRPTASG